MPSGEAELAALQQAPGDQQKAVALAEVLLARAQADAEFGQALRELVGRRPSRSGRASANVTNTISGGTQHGPVLQGRDFSNLTFGAAPPRRLPRPEDPGAT